jgi:cytochrome P450
MPGTSLEERDVSESSATSGAAQWACEHFTPTATEMLQDPYPVYQVLRETCPVARSDAHEVTLPPWAPQELAGDTRPGYWVLSQYDDIYRVAREHSTFISGAGTLLPDLGIPRPLVPQEKDQPLHNRFRKLISRVFTPHRIAELEADLRNITTDLLDSFVGKGEVEIVRAFTERLPTYAVWRDPLLGKPLPFEREGDFEETIAQLVYEVNHVPESGADASLAIRDYLAKIVADRQRHPANDIPTVLAEATIDGKPMDPEDRIDMLFLLFSAGIETTSSALSSWLLFLWQHPEHRAELRDNPSMLPQAVEELLRYLGPTQAEKRTAIQDTEIHGTNIRRGDSVMVLWGSANRDEGEFPRPDEFVPDRFPNRHLAFGAGIHRCLGAHLARLEARVALEEILRRIPDYVVKDPESIRWDVGISRGIHELVLTF